MKSVDVKTSDDLWSQWFTNLSIYKIWRYEDLQGYFSSYTAFAPLMIIYQEKSQGILKYLEGCLERPLMHKISGDVWRLENTFKTTKRGAVG